MSSVVGRNGCVWADFFVCTVLCAGWRWDANSGEKAAKWEESGGLNVAEKERGERVRGARRARGFSLARCVTTSIP